MNEFSFKKNKISSDTVIQESINNLLAGYKIIVVDSYGFLGESLLESIRDELFSLKQKGFINFDRYKSILNKIHLCQCYPNNIRKNKQTIFLTLDVSWNFS